MVRVRLVTTPIWSQEHLVRALAQVGFSRPEVHREAVPLESWRGIPLGGSANVVVRRDQIGSAGDDFGFVRNARGSFDAVISEIHFNRFDRRWLEDLARRHDELARADGKSPPANVPTGWERRELHAPPPVPGAATSPVQARAGARSRAGHEVQQEVSRSRAETASALDDLRKQHKKSTGPGCVAMIVAPLVVWFLVSATVPGLRGAPGFFGIVMPLWFALGILRAVTVARRTRVAADGLIAKLPSSAEARAAAESFLESRLKPAGAKTEDALVKELLRLMREPR